MVLLCFGCVYLTSLSQKVQFLVDLIPEFPF